MSNETKQTAVEWLISQLQKSKDFQRVLNEVSQMSSAKIDIIAESKRMNRQEIIDAYHTNPSEAKWQNRGFEFYNETYGGNK
jgi:hypothetical protein